MAAPTQSFPAEILTLPFDATGAERLGICKAFILARTEQMKSWHAAGATGIAVTEARAEIIDVLLVQLFERARKHYQDQHGVLPAPVALLALGGYGRRELCPLSDIDLMFLYPTKTKAATIKPLQEFLTNEILYPLWDCGLKVGHSTRNADEVFTEARKDIQTKTALLESRLIAGSASLYETFTQAYRSFYTTEKPKEYIAQRLADQATRRAKYGDTVFLQEPDIKNGVGGLRDYQNALWMARVKLGVSTIDELATQNYLRAEEVTEFNQAYDFLLRVRNELHFMVSHPTDVLDLAIQPRLARNLGFTQDNDLERVEFFMQDYYRSARSIFRMSKLVENRLALTLEQPENDQISFREVLRAQRFQRTKRLDGFIMRGRELAAERDNVFTTDPVRLIRVFRHCQQLNCIPDFHLTTKIRENLDLITEQVIHSKDACVSFKAILSEAGAVHPSLKLMHELGVLGRFIPEFDELTCLVQHEFYHRYTADVHTLNAIRELDRIFSEAEPITLKYREALHETADPTLLYLILLLHDIGKAIGIQGHAASGVKIADPILQRLGVSTENRALVSFIIKNHLIMARFWQKRDVDDPQTAAAFAEMVEDPEKLRHLYVHTFCDARGTAASLWNSYKDTLHTGLYRRTLERLNLGEEVHARYLERKKMTQQELIARNIPGISPDEIIAHFGLLPERYSIHTDADEIALHIQMVHRLLKTIANAESVGSLRPVIEWQDDINRSYTIVNVVTWDRAGLFYKLAGAFNLAGLSILGAKVNSRSDHIAIDTFYVIEPGRGVVQSANAQAAFEKNIEAALLADKDLYPQIVAEAKKHTSRYTLDRNSGPHTSFPPTVEVYHELTMDRTIVEIQARDQIGLLFRLAKGISDQGFDITFARIGTERGIALDTFYIVSSDSASPADNDRLHALRDILTEVITPAPVADQVG
ncbi:MAG: [protein-PII] uridylyltransferase [Cephaloticoccus sp.]|nr:[protein-PII] uridylyltransferase [Cephaloticoccus sp.]MCF7761076.1 [protein-PII] uridylyltransferase [Cephaloticoccus sp.]